jgi:hypothetical protein
VGVAVGTFDPRTSFAGSRKLITSPWQRRWRTVAKKKKGKEDKKEKKAKRG